MSDPNNTLIARASAGDEDALTALLERAGPAVRDRLRIPPKFRSVLSADDVMQQAYIEVCLHIAEFEPVREGAFDAWLSTIATNVLRDAIDWLSAIKRGGGRTAVTPISPERSTMALIETLGVDTDTPSEAAAMRDWTVRLEAALEALPEGHRTVVRLFDLQQLSAQSVAGELGCSIGAMYMLRRRALWKLRELLSSTDRALPISS